MNVLEKKIEKYKNFSILIKKEITKIDETGNESFENISYKIKFIDSARFMASSLSNLLDNFTDKGHKITCKGCDYFLEYESVKDNLTKYNAHFSIKIILTKLIKN